MQLPSVEGLNSFTAYFDITMDFLLDRKDEPFPLSVLTEELSGGVIMTFILHAKKMFTSEQKSAILAVIGSMKFHTEVPERTAVNGEKPYG